jgi:hypothetical protein
MRVVIDRFEGKFAVMEMEDKQMVDMPRVLLPEGAKEGNVIEIRIAREETGKRKDEVEKMCEGLWE